MKRLIFYPGFEVSNLDWLKFALLYVDTLNPIIPESGDKGLTDLHLKLTNETDLIDSHRPDYHEGRIATRDAIEAVQNVLKRPKLYSDILGKGDIRKTWERESNHNYTLFHEKYADDWEHFCCIENKLGTLTKEGMRLPRKLAFLYMTLLAQIIADAQGVSPITDDRDLDKFSIFTRTTCAVVTERLKIAQAVIDLKLPANLSRIKLDEVIKLRKRPGFKKGLQAFHQEFDRYFDSIEKEISPKKFVDSFNSIWKSFSDDFLITGAGAVSFGLGVWILLHSPQATTAAYLKELVGAGGALTIGGAVRVKNTWKNTQTKRYCRKYMTNLSKLEPAQVRPRG
jgi:hypothetical protein